MYSSKGFMLVWSLNPDTEDEDESEHEEANKEEVPARTDSESKEKIVRQSVKIQVNSIIHAVPTKFNEERFITVT